METTRSATFLRMMREVLAKRANVADEEGADSGFTLIELMVVLLILAILLAIAIPTFLGVTKTANDRASQSNLTNAVTSAKSDYVNTQDYGTPATALANLQGTEPSMSFSNTTANSTRSDGISVGTYNKDGTVGTANNAGMILLATYSTKTNTCWYAEDNSTGGTVTPTGGTVVPQGTNFGSFSTTVAANCSAALGNVANFPTNWQGNGYP
jgi:type IV pilus assembly protein PilA